LLEEINNHIQNLYVNQQQFFTWVNNLLYLNRIQHENFLPIHMNQYYICLNEFIETGEDYIKNAINSISDPQNSNYRKYNSLLNVISSIEDAFDENELVYIKYR
jgi:hypothetical protein